MAILAFHDIDDRLNLGVNFYPEERFRTVLDILTESGFGFCSLNDLTSRSNDRSKCVSLTFDDGYESIYRKVLPITSRRSIPITVFIPLGFIGQSNSWDYSSLLRKVNHLSASHLREMSAVGVQFGSHGVEHVSLPGLSSRLLKLELEKSKKGLEDLLGTDIRYISYPFGRFDERVENFAIDAGYQRGFSLSHFMKSRSGFTLPRFGVYAIDTPLSILRKVGDGKLDIVEKLKGAIINSYSSGTIILQRLTNKGAGERH